MSSLNNRIMRLPRSPRIKYIYIYIYIYIYWGGHTAQVIPNWGSAWSYPGGVMCCDSPTPRGDEGLLWGWEPHGECGNWYRGHESNNRTFKREQLVKRLTQGIKKKAGHWKILNTKSLLINNKLDFLASQI